MMSTTTRTNRAGSDNKNHFNLAVIGGGGVGKSALTIQFVQHQFCDEYDPTIEDNFRKQVVVDNEVCILDIVDTAGQEEYTALRDQHLRSGEAFLLVFSVTSYASYCEVEEHIERIIRVKDSETVPVVLVGNKCDMEGERQVGNKEALEFAKKHNLSYFETSAKNRINVDECFFEVVRKIRSLSNTKNPNKKKSKKLSHQCTIL
jgi:GTPase KRas